MEPFTAFMLISGGLQVMGQLQANKAEAEAHEQNALFFMEQQKLSAMATRREVDIFEREGEAFFGDQVSAYAKAGVDISGSVLRNLAATKTSIARERAAIIEQGKLRENLAGMKASESMRQAEQVRDKNFLDVLTIAASTGSNIARTSQPSPSSSGNMTRRVGTFDTNFSSTRNPARTETFGLDIGFGE